MSRTLTAHEQPISKIFSDDYVFRIPSYQRPYAWTTEQAGELFDDLVESIDKDDGDVSDTSPYFLGSIVLIKQDATPDADVVDGQQRLTTLTLLLAAIRATVAPVSASYLTTLLYERGNPITGTQDRFRLTLRPRDSDFFKKNVQREDGFNALVASNTRLSDSQSNLRNNARLFKDRLTALSEARRLKLAQFIVTRCFLVTVATPDLDSAYRIFSVLNSRGLDLSATDILKADIIGAIPEKQRDEYTEKWEDTEELLGREGFSDLFSHIRMVYRRAKPKGTLLKEFKDHVPAVSKPAQFIETVLSPMANVYAEVSGAEYASTTRAEEINETLRWLNKLEFKDWVPPALAFAVHHRDDSAAMETFFNALERLAFSMLVRGIGINGRIERFSALTGHIEAGEGLLSASSPMELSSEEQFFTYLALDGPLYATLAARARSLVLLRLDSLLSGGGATYEHAIVTVEHVLPQNPSDTSEWVKWWPDARERSNWVHRVGNLALLSRSKNSAASNYEFERKKAAYFARKGVSPFQITTQVLGYTKWDSAGLEKRQIELMAKLEKHWRLEGRKDPLLG